MQLFGPRIGPRFGEVVRRLSSEIGADYALAPGNLGPRIRMARTRAGVASSAAGRTVVARFSRSSRAKRYSQSVTA